MIPSALLFIVGCVLNDKHIYQQKNTYTNKENIDNNVTITVFSTNWVNTNTPFSKWNEF